MIIKKEPRMKKITSLQILMLMTLAVGSSQIYADAGSKSMKKDKASRSFGFKKSYVAPIPMGEEEALAMQELIAASKLRIQEEMGEFPTEHSIKKFIHKAVEEFKQSSRNEEAVERAMFKLHDACIAIRHFKEKLESLDKHGLAQTHIRSLQRKARNAKRFVKEHAVSEDSLNLSIGLVESYDEQAMPELLDVVENEMELQDQEDAMLDDILSLSQLSADEEVEEVV